MSSGLGWCHQRRAVRVGLIELKRNDPRGTCATVLVPVVDGRTRFAFVSQPSVAASAVAVWF